MINISRVERDFPIGEITHKSWTAADEVSIKTYWSGEIAPGERHFKTKLLWSAAALYVRFEANQAEPLVVSDSPNLSRKTDKLWERDVCEIFLAPNPKQFRRYYEFEIAPTGEWIDLQIHQLPDVRETDDKIESGMQTAAKIDESTVWMAFKVGWKVFGKVPTAGERWKGNIFRCVGAGATRGYLAWQPTLTETPNFHVPERFGDFEFAR